MPTKEDVIEVLKKVKDPEIMIDIWTLELVYDVKVEDDKAFVKMLDNIRFGKIDEEDIQTLRSRFNQIDNSTSIKPTMLVTHNSQVENINSTELNKIPRESKIFKSIFFGNKHKFDFL